jgi:hypothetical protein
MGFPIRPIGPLTPLHQPITVAPLNTDMTPPLSKMKSIKKSESFMFFLFMGVYGLKIDEKKRSIRALIDSHLRFRS